MRILNIGACSIAYVYSVAHIARQGETISANLTGDFPGGKGLNQSIALARAGAEVFHAGCIGKDGVFLKELMEESGVHTDYVKVVSENTGHEIIQVDEDGYNGCLTYPGANEMIDEKFISSVLEHFGEDDYLILQNEIGHIPYIVDCAYERGIKVVFNPSPLDEKVEKVDFRKLSWLIVNEKGAKKIAKSGNSTEALRVLKETYPNLEIVLILGKRGCLYTCGNEVRKHIAYDANGVDTIEAEDTFVRYFLAGIATSIPYMNEIQQTELSLLECSEVVSRKTETVLLIEQYIEENLKQITLSDLARKMNYSVAYTSRWIRHNMQITYNELVQKKRCAVAAKLLQSTDLPIGEIIDMVGYHNESFFRKKFSSIYGENPSRFREKKKNR